jgi:hypothetical protein
MKSQGSSIQLWKSIEGQLGILVTFRLGSHSAQFSKTCRPSSFRQHFLRHHLFFPPKYFGLDDGRNWTYNPAYVLSFLAA